MDVLDRGSAIGLGDSPVPTPLAIFTSARSGIRTRLASCDRQVVPLQRQRAFQIVLDGIRSNPSAHAVERRNADH
jgi:hypothetical protein